jgi:hypothetical protein
MIAFRNLRADEIEVRVDRINQNGCALLLYKDARCDMNVLDETVGSENWQRKHSRDNANCIVSIWSDERKQWIEKEDTGTESYTEKTKGLASDSFKRACVNWGIGRELYTAPFIWVSAAKFKIEQKNGKYTTYDKFKVSKLVVDNKRIVELAIINARTGQQVYYWKDGDKEQSQQGDAPATTTPPPPAPPICQSCGQPVKQIRGSDGTVWTPIDVLNKTGGVCYACYRNKGA